MFFVFRKCHLATIVMGSILCWTIGGVCPAQPPQGNQPSRPQRSNDSFWKVLPEAFKDASNNRRYLWVLLEHPAIQAEIGLDEAELKSLDELNKKHFTELQAIREKYKDNFDRVKLHKELVEVIDQQDATFLELVAKSCDFKRLIEIDVQAYGTRVVTQTEIAKRIGMSAERLSEIRALCDKRRREEMEEIGAEIQKRARNGSMEEVREIFRNLDKKLNDCLKSKLTSQELESLNELKGVAMALPEDLLEPRRRGPGDRRNERDGETKDPDKPRNGKDDDGNGRKDNCRNTWSLARAIACC